jgi:hypothetical protein
VLRQQLEDFRAGLPPGNHVPLEALSKREKGDREKGDRSIFLLDGHRPKGK